MPLRRVSGSVLQFFYTPRTECCSHHPTALTRPAECINTGAMQRTPWFRHPIAIFVFSVVALGLSLFLYIRWYMEVSAGLDKLMRRFEIDSVQMITPQTGVVVVVLSVLVGIILMGIFTIFLYNLKTVQLYRLQHNFINNFTHELKTPVTSLRLFLETFQRHELSVADRHRCIEYMLSDVARLSENINRILNLARLESKSYRGHFVLSDLVEAIDRCIAQNAALFEGAEIRVHPPESGTVFYAVDLPLFEMLVMNLLTNALKYNESPVPRVDIRFSLDERWRHVHVADNGIGLAPAEAKKVFRKFYQVGLPRRLLTKGSGLGLNLVQNIARIHKGRIRARSEGPGKGTVFTLSLPMSKQTHVERSESTDECAHGATHPDR